MNIFGGTIHKLEQGLDYAVNRNQTIANNIANVDTPNYKAQQITFKQVLEHENEQMKAKHTHPKHIPFSPQGQFHIKGIDRQNTYNHNGNNVDIDKEMATLAENQIYYRALVDRLNGKFRSLQTVVKGGR